MLLDENVIGWECYWMRMLLYENVIGWEYGELNTVSQGVQKQFVSKWQRA